jgi:hypothetical protein
MRSMSSCTAPPPMSFWISARMDPCGWSVGWARVGWVVEEVKRDQSDESIDRRSKRVSTIQPS